jgi:hypothetical protein
MLPMADSIPFISPADLLAQIERDAAPLIAAERDFPTEAKTRWYVAIVRRRIAPRWCQRLRPMPGSLIRPRARERRATRRRSTRAGPDDDPSPEPDLVPAAAA